MVEAFHLNETLSKHFIIADKEMHQLQASASLGYLCWWCSWGVWWWWGWWGQCWTVLQSHWEERLQSPSLHRSPQQTDLIISDGHSSLMSLYGHVETDQLKSYNLIMIECLHHSCGLHHSGRVSTSVGVSGAVHLTNVVAAAVLHHHWPGHAEVGAVSSGDQDQGWPG